MAEVSSQGIRVGPAGWAYEDWKGVVYPKDLGRGLHPLELLCRWFDTVEVNSSFYRPTNPRHAESWIEKVRANPRFRFTAKLWERFTHQRRHAPNPEDIHAVKEGFAPLTGAGVFGALLLQFPWSFKRTGENRLWLAKVVDAFEEYPLVVEVRHSSWDRPEVYEGLAERGVAFCNIDQPLFRDSIEPSEKTTAPLAYVRLHGRNVEDWFREDAGRDERYDYLYSEDELRPWIETVESLGRTGRDVYAVTNNHYRGQAVVNALEMQAAMGLKNVEIPPQLEAAYPRLRNLRARAHVSIGTDNP